MLISPFPSLQLNNWRETRDTLHKYCQMVGAIREAFTEKHPLWWHISLRVEDRGLTTTALPKIKSGSENIFEVILDLLSSRLIIVSNYREEKLISLTGQSLNALCDETCSLLSDINITPPLERPSFIDGKPGKIDTQSLSAYWTALKNIDGIFKKFSSGIPGEKSPVQLWPHHFDLAFCWFSGRLIPGKDPNDPESSKEQMTFGFSTGDEIISDAYFYATAYPLPGAMDKTIFTSPSFWNTYGFNGAILKYDDCCSSGSPEDTLMTFLKEAHLAGSALMK